MRLAFQNSVWSPCLLALFASLHIAVPQEAKLKASADKSCIREPEETSRLQPERRTFEKLLPIISCNNQSAEERLRAVYALGDELSGEEVVLLLAFLKNKPDPHENLGELYGLKNEILNTLRHQATPVSQLTDTLADMYRDVQQDPVMRDYAIQHLVTWYEQEGDQESSGREKIRELLREASGENSSIAGTALLGMHRLSENGSEFDSKEIDQLALKFALSPDAGRATKITAIQVCAERNLTALYPALEAEIKNTNSLPLRLSAIAALGVIGTNSSAALIREFQEQELLRAIDLALRNLNEKKQLKHLH